MSDIRNPTLSAAHIESLIRKQATNELQQTLASIHPADIANLLDELSRDDGVVLFGLLNDEIASEVLDETRSLTRQDLVEEVDDERLANLLDTLPEDDAAEFLAGLPDPYRLELLTLMEPQEAQEVRELLQYESRTAGRLMVTDMAVLQRHWTISETLDYLRIVSASETEVIHYLYATDRNGKLAGVVPLRALVTAQPATTVAQIMIPDVISVRDTAEQEVLAEMVARYDFVSIPVVDAEDKLVGVVTVDDVLDILAEEATEDIQRLGGSEPLAQPYFSATLWQVVGKRIVWLLLLFVASTITGYVIRSFESTLNATILLSAFIPLIIGTGGNAGSQTVATIIRAMAVGEVKLLDVGQAWRREISAGLIIGLLLGLIGFAQAFLWSQDLRIALVIAITLPVVVMWANTMATLVPLIAQRLSIDPTVVSTPMITTIVDTTGLFIYFTIASAII